MITLKTQASTEVRCPFFGIVAWANNELQPGLTHICHYLIRQLRHRHNDRIVNKNRAIQQCLIRMAKLGLQPKVSPHLTYFYLHSHPQQPPSIRAKAFMRSSLRSFGTENPRVSILWINTEGRRKESPIITALPEIPQGRALADTLQHRYGQSKSLNLRINTRKSVERNTIICEIGSPSILTIGQGFSMDDTYRAWYEVAGTTRRWAGPTPGPFLCFFGDIYRFTYILFVTCFLE